MCAVCGAEGVVDVDLSHVGHSLCQSCVILGLALLEANVLKQNSLARLYLCRELLCVLADNVLRELDFLTEQLGQALCDRRQGVLHVELALRTAQVRAQNNCCVVAEQVLDGLERCADALVIGDVAVLVLRNVEVAADDNLLTGNVNILDALLVVLHSISLSLMKSL